MPEYGLSDHVSPSRPEFEYPKLISRDRSQASYFCEIIIGMVKQFESTLDDEHEVALKLASFGQSIILSVTSIGYSDPSTLIFHGFVGDQPAVLIQHITQFNFLMLAAKKSIPNEPPRRLAGFSAEGSEWRK